MKRIAYRAPLLSYCKCGHNRPMHQHYTKSAHCAVMNCKCRRFRLRRLRRLHSRVWYK